MMPRPHCIPDPETPCPEGSISDKSRNDNAGSIHEPALGASCITPWTVAACFLGSPWGLGILPILAA